MISKPSLRTLIKRRLGDAKVLLKNRRYPASIYMAGYGLELALKYRICKITRLASGFPETRQEFSRYYQDMRRQVLRNSISELKDIRHHNLQLLLYYSGKELFVTNDLALEWDMVRNWRPEIRYLDDVIRKKRANEFLRSIEAILAKILFD